MSMIPLPVSGALQVYLAQDGNLYAVNQVDGSVYQVGGSSAPLSAPPDGGGVFLAQGALFEASGSSVTLDINADGDLMATQTAGPNAGKSVNLTYGKWA